MDQLLNQYGLAHACAAEQTDFTALGIGLQQVDDLDTGLQNLNGRTLFGEVRGIAIDALTLGVLGDGFAAVDGLAQNVEHSAQGLLAHGNLNRCV